jgi:hypothetical protein
MPPAIEDIYQDNLSGQWFVIVDEEEMPLRDFSEPLATAIDAGDQDAVNSLWSTFDRPQVLATFPYLLSGQQEFNEDEGIPGGGTLAEEGSTGTLKKLDDDDPGPRPVGWRGPWPPRKAPTYTDITAGVPGEIDWPAVRQALKDAAKDEEDTAKGFSSKEEFGAEAPPGHEWVYLGNNKWDYKPIEGVMRNETAGVIEGLRTGKIPVPLGDGTYVMVDREDPDPPLRFDNREDGQAAVDAMGEGWRLGTSGGFYSPERAPAERPASKRSLDQTIEDLAIEGKFTESLAMDAFRDRLNAEPADPADPEKTSFTLAEATQIAERYAGSAEEFQTIFDNIMAIDVAAELTQAPTGAPRALFDERTNLEVSGFRQQFAPPTPSGIEVMRGLEAIDGQQIPSVPSGPRSEVGTWQSAYTSAYQAALEDGEDPVMADQLATRAASAEVAAQAAGGVPGFDIRSPATEAIAGVGPDADKPLFRAIRAVEQGAEIVNPFAGTAAGGPPPVPGGPSSPGMRVLATSGLTPAQRSRFYQRRPGDDELLQTVGAGLTEEDKRNLLSGGPTSITSGPGATFRNGRRLPDKEPAGSQFLHASADIGQRFGLRPDEVDALREDAKRRRAQQRANVKGFKAIGDAAARRNQPPQSQSPYRRTFTRV